MDTHCSICPKSLKSKQWLCIPGIYKVWAFPTLTILYYKGSYETQDLDYEAEVLDLEGTNLTRLLGSYLVADCY